MNNLVRGRKRTNTGQLNVNINAKIHNRFDIEVIDSSTGKIKQKAYAENVICKGLWDCLALGNSSSSAYNQYIAYGSGSGTPASNDAALFSLISTVTPAKNDDVQNVDLSLGVASLTRKGILSEQTAVGSTITEVGIMGAGKLATHAMLKDMNGNSISIQKTSTDIINIYSTVYIHWNPDGYNGIKVTGKYDANIYCGQYKTCYFIGWLMGTFYSYYSPESQIPTNLSLNTRYDYIPLKSDGTENFSGSSGTAFFGLSNSVDATNKKITLTSTRIPASSCNNNGIGYLVISQNSGNWPIDRCDFLIDVSKWFPGTDIVGESIGTGDGVTTSFKTKFPYPTNAKVYVNGVETAATVNKEPNTTVLHQFMKQISPSSTENNILDVFGSCFYSGDARILVPANTDLYLYNELAGKAGIKSYYVGSGIDIYVSDDLSTWTQVGKAAWRYGTFTIPEQYQKSKFFKFVAKSSGVTVEQIIVTGDAANIVFATAQATGAVITSDYHTPVIAKDVNHVFDFSMTIQLGEYTGT